MNISLTQQEKGFLINSDFWMQSMWCKEEPLDYSIYDDLSFLKNHAHTPKGINIGKDKFAWEYQVEQIWLIMNY